MITIAKTDCNFEREPLRAPFGFKGGFLTEIWQSVAGLRSTDGRRGVGIASQSVLWSDETVFARFSESAGNGLMFQLTAHALRLCVGRSFGRPEELLDQILPEVLAFGRTITGQAQLRPTFALNALVAVDNAAWQLYAAARGTTSLDALSGQYRTALPCRHPAIAVIPLISYAVAVEQAAEFARAGHPLLKIKIGSDPARDGDRAKMLEWDCARISAIHAAVRDCATPHTASGRIAYYLDANGHYDSKDRVRRLLDHCERIGALEHVVLLEEPFAEDFECDVRDLPVRVAADESAHSVADVAARIDAGYGAIALKPVAKTLSVSLRMVAAAQARGVPCFCADLTVTPILVDWGKIVAARLDRLPGLSVGVLETNGAQNYRDWPRLESYHPRAGASWTKSRGGLFALDDEFFARSGGVFEESAHYAALVPGISSS
ncbi:MAG TPA: enolase C-terminal domain-like protein [Opitutaceae bacterium]|nr:enolase C-terminal domain-like protein [Opitutaceae bacterium]